MEIVTVSVAVMERVAETALVIIVAASVTEIVQAIVAASVTEIVQAIAAVLVTARPVWEIAAIAAVSATGHQALAAVIEPALVTVPQGLAAAEIAAVAWAAARTADRAAWVVAIWAAAHDRAASAAAPADGAAAAPARAAAEARQAWEAHVAEAADLAAAVHAEAAAVHAEAVAAVADDNRRLSHEKQK